MNRPPGRMLLDNSLASVELEKRYVHRSGDTVWSRARISLVQDSSGSPRILLSKWKTLRRAS